METAKSFVEHLFGGNGHDRKCEVCGNEYDKCFEVNLNGETHVFDSFECAIHALAPRCKNCGCQIIGHGVEADGDFYCCSNCVRQRGVHNFGNVHMVERSKV